MKTLAAFMMAAALGMPGVANARAFAGVQRAIVDFSISPMNDPAVFPALHIALRGGLPVSSLVGQGFAAGGCAPSFFGVDCTLSGTVNAGVGQYSSLQTVLSGDFLVTNTSASALGLVSWAVNYSAFNPGGSPVGASVDSPAREFAAYSSMAATNALLDAHACDTRAPTQQTLVAAAAPAIACGVLAPNDGDISSFTAPLNPGQTFDVPFTITITASAGSFVPEPAGLVLLLAPLGAAALVRRR